ncbi:DUF3325 domain-containing protein [Pseudomonas sp. UL073]|uniref:DUF3325 domain-containing protein n=1 Tax=Zestomonas insulae TaxID=2809017 RepID=A0ABS2IL69_9GAMM|nr:DUF3325 domain-containing protein [Pseudomonas insulae]MBM7062628.1 DUF3325 domain-containing protein [Pseudomonas insulae]
MELNVALALGSALAFAGLAGLCLGMDRHHKQVWAGKAPRRQRALRLAGWLLLALALWPCLQVWGSAVGPVVWCGLLSAAALGLVLLLPYAPRLTAALAGLATLAVVPLLFTL